MADLPIAVDAGRIGLTGHSFGGWTALETARRDPRARVVFPMAPGFRAGATPDFVAELARPLCLFGGSEDDTTPFESDQRAPYDLARSPKMLVEILGAGHLDFSNLCDVPGVSSFVDDGCDPEKVDPAEVHRVVRTIATAFVGRYLFADEAYDTLLEPEGACAVGVAECWRSP